MSMIAPEAASALTGSQKASAGLGAVPTPRTNHPYIVGIALVVIGGFGLVGSLNGTLPSMLAALFVPNALDVPGGPGVLGTIENGITNFATNPLGAMTGGALG